MKYTVVLLGGVLSLTWAAAVLASDKVYAASVIDLLTFPERYEGRVIRIKGFLDTSSGINLFFTRDHAQIRDFESSIQVSDDEELCIVQSLCGGQYVELVGTFVGRNKIEHSIVEVSRIRKVADQEYCYEKD